VNNNYLRLGENSIQNGSGTVIEVGSQYSIGDITNNPPIVYFSNGIDVGRTWNTTNIGIVYTVIGNTTVIDLTFIGNHPTSYTIQSQHSGESSK